MYSAKFTLTLGWLKLFAIEEHLDLELETMFCAVDNEDRVSAAGHTKDERRILKLEV